MTTAVRIHNVYGEDLFITPETAKELVEEKVIEPLKWIGIYRLVDGQDEKLWAVLRRRAR